ncbi:MAG: indole-3-glycerol phosphate synthase TrpC [Lachnospiraceae bacterium]|nr:indole-3-glycerol phosphate synthase TrpC [Lachnospiraceae bacterium]
MSTILDEIAKKTGLRIEEEKKKVPLNEIRRMAEQKEVKSKSRFFDALSKPGMSYICEVKKASPSKGIIADDFPYVDIAVQYEKAGASAISCLTEPYWFLGSDSYLKEIEENVSIPILRKDFTVDEYMIYQAYLMGASAVLLICAILSLEELRDYRLLAESFGMDALVEAHNEEEIRTAVRSEAKIIGVNNRNLKDFSVDTGNSARLRELIPEEVIFVSESGIKTAKDVKRLREMGTDAVLIGETLMRSPDKKAKLAELDGRSS